MKKTIYQIHKWSGLTLGFLIFLLAVSGVGITFRSELMPLAYPELFRISPGESYLPIESLYVKAAEHIGDHSVLTNLYTAHDKDEAWILLYRPVGDLFPTMMTINPFNGEIVGEMSMIKNFFAVMLFLHANLFLGKVGTYFVGLLGLLLIFFVGSGIYVWLPKFNLKAKLARTFGKYSIRDQQKTHHVLGLVLAIPLLISAVTGFLTVFDIPYYIMRPLRGEAVRPEEMERKSSCTYQEQRTVLKSLPPETASRLISVHFCTKKNGLMKVSTGLVDQDFLEGYERVIIDTKTNQVLQTFNSAKDPSSWNIKRLFMFPVHTGEYFGTFGKTVNFLTGLGLMIIYLSGLLLYLKRRQRKKSEILSSVAHEKLV